MLYMYKILRTFIPLVTFYYFSMSIKQFNHDEFFKKALEYPPVAREFCETYLPDYIMNIVDLSTLKMQKESFIEKSLKKHYCDVLFSVKMDDKPGYLFFLAEHQSRSEHFMALRLFKYQIEIWRRYISQNPKAEHLPLIYAAVFYNGKAPYAASTNIMELFHDKDLSRKIFLDGYKLINLNDIADEELRKQAGQGRCRFS